MNFEFNGVPVKTPDKFAPNAATTSTDDSDRTQDLVMHNTPIGTVESYSFEWKDIDTKEAAKIFGQVKNKKEFSMRHISAETGNWETRKFYATTFTWGTLKKVNGKDAWESLSFNAICINPI